MTDQPDTPNASSELMDIESAIINLESVAALVGHVAGSPHECGGELHLLQTSLNGIHATLEGAFRRAWDKHIAEVGALQAELAAERAAKAAPGSKGDIQHADALWQMLYAAGETVRKIAKDKRSEAKRQ